MVEPAGSTDDDGNRAIICTVAVSADNRFGFVDVRDYSVDDIKKILGVNGASQAALMKRTKYSLQMQSGSRGSDGCGATWEPDNVDMLIYLYRAEVGSTRLDHRTCSDLVDEDVNPVPRALGELA